MNRIRLRFLMYTSCFLLSLSSSVHASNIEEMNDKQTSANGVSVLDRAASWASSDRASSDRATSEWSRDTKEENAAETALRLLNGSYKEDADTNEATEQKIVSPSQPSSPKISSSVNLVKLIDGSDVMYDLITKQLTNGLGEFYDFKEERWNSYQKKYVETLPTEKRDAITKVFLSSFSQYDDLEQIMIFRKTIDPNFLNDDFRDGGMTVEGVIGKDSFEPYIYLKYLGDDIGRIGSFKIYTDNFKWFIRKKVETL